MADSTATSTVTLGTVLSVSGTGVTGRPADSTQTLPVLWDGDGLVWEKVPILIPTTAESEGATGRGGGSDLDVLLVDAHGTAGGAAASSSLTIPALTGNGTGLPQRIGASSQTLPSLTASSTGTIPVYFIASSARSLPAITGTGTALAQRFADSAQTLQPVTASSTATSLPARAADSAQTLPAIEATSVGQTQRLADSAAALPLIQASSTAETEGALAAGDRVAASDLVAPSVLTGDATGFTQRIAGSIVTLPTVSGSSTGATEGAVGADDSVGQSDQQIPSLTIESTGYLQQIAESDQTLPSLVAVSTAARQALGVSEQALPALVAVSTGTSGAGFSNSDATLPIIAGQSVASTSRVGVSDVTLAQIVALSQAGGIGAESAQALPILESVGDGVLHRVGEAVITLPLVTGESDGVTGRAGASELVLPMLSAQSAAAAISAGASILVLPSWVASGIGQSPAGTVAPGTAAAQGQTFALDTKDYALTEFVGATFNSYAYMGDVLLAANEDGVFVIGGSTDNGTPIDARVTFPLPDDESRLRRLARLTVGYRNDGDLRLSVQADDGEQYEYILEETGRDECHPNRVRIGKGIKGRYWTLTVENVGGADFAIDAADVDWEILSRRVP
jgi:hypothetical protein